jgi:hypothetical protein
MKMWNIALVFIGLIVCFAPTVATAADYDFLDKNLNYKGYMQKGDTRIDFYDKNNMPAGWIDRSSGARFDKHNNFEGWIIKSGPDGD